MKDKNGVACLVIGYKDNTIGIYLSKRLGDYETGKFCCPGGMVDDTDKDAWDAIIRELKEETDLDITDSNRLIRASTSTHIGGKSDYTIWFMLYLREGEVLKNMEPTKHTSWEFVPLNKAEELPLMVSTNDAIKYLKLLL